MDEIQMEIMKLKDERLRRIALNIYKEKGLREVAVLLNKWQKMIR